MSRLAVAVFVLFQCIILPACQAQSPKDQLDVQSLDAEAKRYTRQSQKSYADVIADLEFAVSQHNYRLTGRNRVGKAIGEMEEKVLPQATVLHFCNTQAAKDILDINPEYLLHMPCRITVREQGDAIMIDARLLPENDPQMLKIALKVNKMMRSIVDFAAKD